MNFDKPFRIIETGWPNAFDDIGIEAAFMELGEQVIQITIPEHPVIVIGKRFKLPNLDLEKMKADHVGLLRLDDFGMAMLFGERRTIILSFIFGPDVYGDYNFKQLEPKKFLTKVAKQAHSILGIDNVLSDDAGAVTKNPMGMRTCYAVIDNDNILTEKEKKKVSIISCHTKLNSFCGHVIINTVEPMNIYPYITKKEPSVNPVNVSEYIRRSVHNSEVSGAFITAFWNHGVKTYPSEPSATELLRGSYWRDTKYTTDDWNLNRCHHM